MSTSRTSSLWTFAIVSVALFMVVLDNLVVTTALPSIRAEFGGGLQALEWTVNAYTLSFAVLLLTGAALGDRFGRRRMFVIGLGIFTVASALAALAPGTGRVDRRPRAAGRRRRDRHPAHADPALDRVPGREARARHRRLVGHLRPRRRARPAGRRRGRRGHLVALDLLAQRADRPRADAAGLSPPGRVARPGRPAGPPRARARRPRPARHRLRDRARRRGLGWTSHHRPRLAARRRHRPGGVRGLGAARPGADAADAVLPLARLRRLQRGLAGDVLRRLRLDLPAGPVLPGHAGALAAGGRAADAAVDHHADVRRADRRPAERPDRLAPADGDRPGAAGDRDRLAGRRLDADRARTPSS